MTMKCRPLASVNSVTFFSNCLRSCAGADRAASSGTRQKRSALKTQLPFLRIAGEAVAQTIVLCRLLVCELAGHKKRWPAPPDRSPEALRDKLGEKSIDCHECPRSEERRVGKECRS